MHQNIYTDRLVPLKPEQNFGAGGTSLPLDPILSFFGILIILAQ